MAVIAHVMLPVNHLVAKRMYTHQAQHNDRLTNIVLVKTVMTLQDVDPIRPLSEHRGNWDQEISSR